MDFISPSVLAAITEAERLTTVFGYWPSFHDAEVVRRTLESGVGGRPPVLEASLRVFDSSGAVDAQG